MRRLSEGKVSIYTDKSGVYRSVVDLTVLHYVSVCGWGGGSWLVSS